MVRRITVLTIIALCFCGSNLARASSEQSVRLFLSRENKTPVGILKITQWGTGVLKSDFGIPSLTEVTLSNMEQLWGYPSASSKEKQYDLRTFKLWGQLLADPQSKIEEYELNAKFANEKLCAYSISGGLVTSDMQMLVEEDKLNRRHGPSGTTNCSFPVLNP